jgi:D-glycerate 3-kinase
MISSGVQNLLRQAIAGKLPSSEQWPELVAWEMADSRRAEAWGLNPQNVQEQLQIRLHWLVQVAPSHGQIPQFSRPLDDCLELYWGLWLPLALRLKALRDQRQKALIQGILGGQGTGKTTLTLILRHLLGGMGYHTVGLSIDDIYKTYAERVALKTVDPRLKWRGPPGTHDVDLGISTLNQVHNAAPDDQIALPRFDKSLHGGEGDRIAPEPVKDIDILLFEGWFLGVQPVAEAAFDQAPSPIDTEADRQFARDMNRQLQAYLPLWACLDQLMVLYPEDYRISKQWRLQAEHQMKSQGKSGMSDAMIEQFVEYFWRALHPELFVTPLKANGTITDLVVEIDLNRVPKSIYVPSGQPDNCLS